MNKQVNITKQTVLLSVAATLFLLIANSAYWVHSNVFNKQKFTSIVSEAVLSESSRQSVASGIADRLYEGRPVLKNLAGETTTNVVAGLLGTKQAEQVFSAGVERLHVAVTSRSQDSLTIDLSGIKATVQRLSSVLSGDTTAVRGKNIPDELTIIDKQNIPDFYRYGVLFLWLGPAALLGAIALLAYPYVKYKEQYVRILALQGAVVFVTGLLALLIGPLFKPPLLASIQALNARVVASNLYDGFIATYNSQTMILIYLGLAILALSLASYKLIPYISKKVQ